VLRILVTFAPVAALLTITPGAATALIVRNALRGGRRHAFWTNAGNSAGVLVWGCGAAAGVAAVVAASATAFDVIRVAGAIVLIIMGARSLWGRRDRSSDEEQGALVWCWFNSLAVRVGVGHAYSYCSCNRAD